MRLSVLRVCAAVEALAAVSFVVQSHWFGGFMCLLVGAWMWMYDLQGQELARARSSRTVTHNIEIHQHAGESPEVFARRIADELARQR